jgi:hypothetical protein
MTNTTIDQSAVKQSVRDFACNPPGCTGGTETNMTSLTRRPSSWYGNHQLFTSSKYFFFYFVVCITGKEVTSATLKWRKLQKKKKQLFHNGTTSYFSNSEVNTKNLKKRRNEFYTVGESNGIQEGHMEQKNVKTVRPVQELELNASRRLRRKPRTRNDEFLWT